MVETIRVFSGLSPPITIWGGEDKTDLQAFNLAYPEWVLSGSNWLRISDTRSRSGDQSMTFDAGMAELAGWNYTYTIPVYDGVKEISHYWYWDGDDSTQFVYYVSIENSNNSTYAKLEIYPRRQFSTDKYSIKYTFYESTHTTSAYIVSEGSYTPRWIGLKIVWDRVGKTASVYTDLTPTGEWSLAIEYDFIYDGDPTPVYMKITANNQYDGGDWEHVFIDDIIFKNTTLFDSPDFVPTKVEFHKEESSIGGGYMVIPDKNVDFTDYYNIQEEIFIIIDSDYNVIYAGMFTNSTKMKDAVRLEFKDLSHQLHDRYCKRIYGSESGIVTRVGIG